MAGVTLNYKGSKIAAIGAYGSKTIQTFGKYCEADIGVTFSEGPVYPPLPSAYQELQYLSTGSESTAPALGYPRINTGNTYPIHAGDIFRFNFRGSGILVGKRTDGWNINVGPSNDYFNVYSGNTIFCSWRLLTQETTDWMSACGSPTSGIGDGSFDYGQWGTDYHFYGDLGILTVSRIEVINGGSYDTIEYIERVIKALIPCYRKADGVNGFYDTVNDVFYTAVTGTFERGPEI